VEGKYTYDQMHVSSASNEVNHVPVFISFQHLESLPEALIMQLE